MENKHITWIDDARTLAMLLVIIGHCTYTDIMTPYGGISYFGSMSPEEFSFGWNILNNVVAFLYGFHVPLFMVISGACFSLTIHSLSDFKSFLSNKAHKLLLPFLTATFFFAVPLKYLSGYYAGSEHVLRDIFLGQFLLMGNSHLWFVVSLFWIFIIYYVAYKLRISERWWFLPLAACVSVCSMYFTNKGIEFLGVLLALKHFVYFAFGFRFLSKFDKTEWGGKKLLLNVAAYVLLFIFIKRCFNGDTHFMKLVRLVLPVVMGVYGSVIMIHVSKLFSSLYRIKQNGCYKVFAQNSYELYLFSDPFNYVLLYCTYRVLGDYVTSSIDTFLAFFIRFFGTILIALLIIRMKKAIQNKYTSY